MVENRDWICWELGKIVWWYFCNFFFEFFRFRLGVR